MDSAYQSWDVVMSKTNHIAPRCVVAEYGVIERPTSTLEWWDADSEAEIRKLIGDCIERANHGGHVILHYTDRFERCTRANGTPIYHGWMLYRRQYLN